MAKSEAIITTLYKGRVVVRFYEDSHQYWVSVDGGKFKRVPGVTTIIGIKDKSTALGKWQQQVTCEFLMGLAKKGVKFNEEMAVEAVMQHEIQRDEAADIGTEIHAWIEHHIKRKLKVPGFKDLPPMPEFPEALTGINSFLEWEKKNKIKYVSTEKVVYSLENGYIGTQDLEIIDEEHGLCNGDFKSSSGLYNSIRMQTEAYARAAEEEAGVKRKKYKGRWAIRLNKYTEEEYIAREKRKAEIRKAIAVAQGREPKDYPIKPYQVFEAKFLDDEKHFRDRDFEAFKNALGLYRWDKETDSFYNKNW